MLSLTAFADELERDKARHRTYDAMLRKAKAVRRASISLRSCNERGPRSLGTGHLSSMLPRLRRKALDHYPGSTVANAARILTAPELATAATLDQSFNEFLAKSATR
jgi:hypothetical protein